MTKAIPPNRRALISTIALHAAFIALAWLASIWVIPSYDSGGQGEPVVATLQISKADLARAKKAVRDAEKAQASQPKPEPRPQTSDKPLQQTAQTWVDRPDTEVQEEVQRMAAQPSDTAQEQKLKQKQAQVELTEDVKKDLAEENRQRLIKQQLEAVRKQRAELQADIEAAKITELASAGKSKSPAKPETPAGLAGNDNGLSGRYKTALNATARANWNTVQIPEQTRCKVEFTQIRGGEVIDVDFLSCPLNAAGRESIERALYKSPMPYAGFESVFQRKVTLLFCYPDEVCQ